MEGERLIRTCYCHWNVERIAKSKGDNPNVSTMSSEPAYSGGWDWLARIYNDANE